jgi:hypothetical protein
MNFMELIASVHGILVNRVDFFSKLTSRNQEDTVEFPCNLPLARQDIEILARPVCKT